jgi:Ca-activated chloride channel homolog
MLRLTCKGFAERTSITALAVALPAMLISISPRAAAQQGAFTPPANIAHGQAGPALEIPTTPTNQNGGNLLKIPRLQPQSQRPITSSHVSSGQPGHEQVTVTVTDQGGRYITGLQKGDFRLYLDGIQRSVEFLRQDPHTPVSVGIIVDSSGSMEPKIPQARVAIGRFIGDLDPLDDVFLIAFSTRPFLLQPPTIDHRLVMKRLGMLHAYNDTALFDAIMKGLGVIRLGRYDKKALLVVSDGMDNASRSGLTEVVTAARRMGVLIYSIGIGDPRPGLLGIRTFIFGGDRDHVDAETLRDLSSESGARTYLISEGGDGELLRRDCASISDELRRQYTVGFSVSDPSRPGYRRLHIDLPGKPELTVRARRGVTVPGADPNDEGAYVRAP